MPTNPPDEPMTLPEPPMMVLAELTTTKEPHWWIGPDRDGDWYAHERHWYSGPQLLTVIPHPRNDPEAVDLIAASKKGAGG